MGGSSSTSKPAAEAPAPAPETPSKAAARFCAAAERTEWTSPLVTD